MKKTTSTWFLTPLDILICGLLVTGGIFHISGLEQFPSHLADIYREEQISLAVPGSREVQLNRTGAYGIYYQVSLVTAVSEQVQIPPALDCQLESASGEIIKGVPDYEPSNRYWSKQGGGPATLIQSITVDQPGQYEFSCEHPGGYGGSEIQVTIGPNYTWEFIRVSLKYILAVVGMCLSILIPFVISLILFVIGRVVKRRNE
jgi:hypothetical protein